MDEYQIKAWSGWSIEEIIKIERLCFPCPWDEDHLKRMARDRSFRGVVAVADFQRLVGYMFYRKAKSCYLLLNLAVVPEHRRRGVGSLLIDRLRDYCMSDNKAIVTDVREGNLTAQCFLRSRGFRWCKTVEGIYDNTDEAAYLMQYRFVQLPKNRMKEFLRRQPFHMP